MKPPERNPASATEEQTPGGRGEAAFAFIEEGCSYGCGLSCSSKLDAAIMFTKEGTHSGRGELHGSHCIH